MTWTAATKLVPARPSTSCHTSIVTLARFSSQIIDAKLGTQFTCTRRGLTRQTTWVICWRRCQRDYNWNSGQAQSCSKTGFRLRPGWAGHFILVLLRALKNRILKQVASNYMASQKRNNNLNRFCWTKNFCNWSCDHLCYKSRGNLGKIGEARCIRGVGDRRCGRCSLLREDLWRFWMSKWMEGAFENLHVLDLVLCHVVFLIEFGAEALHNSGSKPGTWHCVQATSNPDRSHGGTSGYSATRSSALCSMCSILIKYFIPYVIWYSVFNLFIKHLLCQDSLNQAKSMQFPRIAFTTPVHMLQVVRIFYKNDKLLAFLAFQLRWWGLCSPPKRFAAWRPVNFMFVMHQRHSLLATLTMTAVCERVGAILVATWFEGQFGIPLPTTSTNHACFSTSGAPPLQNL